MVPSLPSDARSFTWAGNAEAERRSMGAVIRYLRELPTTKSARDVSRHPDYEKRGIDIVHVTHDGVTTTIDVKGDRYPERNFFFESWSVAEERIEGCLLTSEADLWYYLFLQTGMAYVLRIPPTRAWFRMSITKRRLPFPEKNVLNNDPEKGRYTTKGYPVPISLVERELKDAGAAPRRISLGHLL